MMRNEIEKKKYFTNEKGDKRGRRKNPLKPHHWSVTDMCPAIDKISVRLS